MNIECSNLLYFLLIFIRKWVELPTKNSKVFEQKGDLLNFKANIDPMAELSRVKPVWAEFKLSWVELSWVELSLAEPGWAELSQAEPSWAKLSQAEPS